MSSVVYTAEEKEMLVQFIKKYPIVEDKKTDATNIQKKNIAWSKICDEYNCNNVSVKRNVVQLKRCWDKIKKQRKTVLAEERRNRMCTGGGPSVPEKPFVPGVESVVPHLAYEVANEFDSDAIMLSLDSLDNSSIPESVSFEEAAKSPIPVTIPTVATPLPASTKTSKQSAIDALVKTRQSLVKSEQTQMQILYDAQIKTEKIRQEIEEEKLKKAKIETATAEISKKIEQEKLIYQQLKTEELKIQIGNKKQ